MLVCEIIELDEKKVWAKSGKTIVRKYRCTAGNRKGRAVSSVSQCFAPIDIAKRLRLKKTKGKLGTRMIRKAKKTKRIDPVSKRVSRLNK